MTAQKQEERKVFHLLHGKPPMVVRAIRVSSQQVEVALSVLPSLTLDVVRAIRASSQQVEVALSVLSSLTLDVDFRDERALFAWEGGLLPNGLPRGSTIIHKEFVYRVLVPWEQAYKKRETDPTEEHLPVRITMDGKEWGAQEIHRYFVLTPARTATVLRFDDKRLAPRYVFVEVEKGGKNVIWRQSSY